MNFATLKGLTIPEGNVVKIESNGITLWELPNDVNDVKLDVFFDFRTVGDISAPNGQGFTLENQGTDTAVTLEAATGSDTIMSVSSAGLTSSRGSSLGYYPTGGIKLVGVGEDLVAGAKTIVFCLPSATPRGEKNAQILAPNVASSASLGVGASDSGQPYHAYARQVGGGDYGLARAVDTDYSVDGSYFAWFGGTKSTERKCVVITTGSASEPSPTKIYVDGVLAGVFDIADQEMYYMDLTSSDNIIRCFTSIVAGSTGVNLNNQDWYSYTLAYFGMTRGEMSEREIKLLSADFGACTSIKLDCSTLNFTDITPKQLIATVTPKQTYDSVIWSSSNTAVASVSADGIVSPESVGECIITATCGEYSASCNVSVAEGFNFLYDWDFTESLTDKRSGMTATVSGATQDENGLTFSAVRQYCNLGSVMAKSRRIEIDVASMVLSGTDVNHRFVLWKSANASEGVLIWSTKNQKWGCYKNSAWKLFTLTDLNLMSGKTVTIDIDANGYAELFVDGISYGSTNADSIGTDTIVYLGNAEPASNGGDMSTTVITGLRIYKI